MPKRKNPVSVEPPEMGDAAQGARARLLKWALPPSARRPEYRREFDKRARSALLNCGCDDDQIERLQAILPAIAIFSVGAPRLADVRARLAATENALSVAADMVRELVEAPAREDALDEARLRVLEGVFALYPERCEPDPENPRSFFEERRTDEREIEVRRMLAAMTDLHAAIKRARQRLPTGQTRSVAHDYPIGLIDAALNLEKESVPVSAQKKSVFRRIAGICYASAGVPNDDPLRAIRAFKAKRQPSKKS